MRTNKSGLARIAMAAPDSKCGGGSWSSDVSRHKYASNPPSKKGTRIKRNVADQFCTYKSCSDVTDYKISGQTRKLESGHSVELAPEKTVLREYRKSQRDFGRKESWGVAVANRSTVSSLVLDNGKAEQALRKIAIAKAEKRAAKIARREQRRIATNAVLAAMQEEIAKVLPSRKSDVIFSMGNAFAGI